MKIIRNKIIKTVKKSKLHKIEEISTEKETKQQK